MAKEITVIPHYRKRSTIALTVEPLSIPDELLAYDRIGGRHFISPATLDRETLDALVDDFRRRLLRSAGCLI
jgi:hypothetical protein